MHLELNFVSGSSLFSLASFACHCFCLLPRSGLMVSIWTLDEFSGGGGGERLPTHPGKVKNTLSCFT